MAETAALTPAPAPATKLWQWLLLYPALGTSLCAAVPTVWNEVKAWRLGVASSQLQLVTEQERLWRHNLECLSEASAWEVDGPRHLVIKVTICSQTGDALLRYYANDWAPQFRWVRAPEGKP